MTNQLEKLRSSLKKYQGFLEQDPSNPDLVAQVADLHYQIGEFDQARHLLTKTIAEGKNEPGLLFRLSNVALVQGNTDEAVEILKSLQAQGVNNAAVQFNLAYAYMYQTEFEQAKQLLEPLIESNDTSIPGISVLLARCYHHLGEPEKSVEIGEYYLENHPEDQEALGVLALAAFDSNEEEKARNWANRAIEINASNLEARIALGSIALETQNTEVAGTHFQTALKKHQKSGRAWSGQGLTEMLNLDLDTATESLKKAVTYMPDHIGTWHSLAWCLLMKDDIVGAKDCFDKAMEVDRNFGETHGGLAIIAYLQGDRGTAKTEARKAVLLDSYSFSGRFAESLLAQDIDPDKAIKILDGIFESKIGKEEISLQETLSKFLKKRKVDSNKIIH